MTKKKLFGMLAAVAAVGALASNANATTYSYRSFCGMTSSGSSDPDSVANSVWTAMGSSGCTGCHNSGQDTTPGAGSPITWYTRGAFEMDDMGNWIKTSYWSPTSLKASASWMRIYNATMPPGSGTTYAPNFPPTAIKSVADKIKDWVNNTLAGCGGAIDAEGSLTAARECIWGNNYTTTATWAGGSGVSAIQHCN